MGKEDLLLLDHSDTTLKLGLVTDIHHDSLDDGKPKEKAEAKEPATVKECPQCAFLMPRATLICPACGHVRLPFIAPHEKGELVEIGVKRKRGVSGDVIVLRNREIPLRSFYAELMGYAELKGYKSGWAANQYKAAAGTWPNAHRNATPVSASYEVLSYIKSRQIAWAKRREAT